VSACGHDGTAFQLSDHFDGKRFHNSAPVPPESFSEDVKVAWELWHKPAKWPKPFATPQHEIADTLVLRGAKATYIGHATVLLQVAGLNVLTDPVFSDFVGPNRILGQRRVTNPGVKLESLPHIDVILISHNHYDHLDLPSIERIAAQQGSAPPRILIGLGNKTLLDKYGLSSVSELDWGDTVDIAGAQFHFLEAIHGSRRGLFDTGMSLWGSFLVQTAEGNFYFAGDTAYGEHFKRIYEQFGPVRLALLPIGAYKPRWFMWREHMDPDEAVRAHLDLHSSESVAIHFETFNLAENYPDAVNDLSAALKRHAIAADRFLVPHLGQTTEAIPLQMASNERTGR
jgi:L-ascorbate metabolism protein UlaG (beta-lactamase superfamily)